MRIMIISEVLATGSAGGQVARGTGRVLLAAGHDIAYFSLEHLPANDPHLRGIKVFPASWAGRFGYVFSLAQAQEIQRAVTTFKPDIAHLIVFGHVLGLSFTVLQTLQRMHVPVVNAPVSYIPVCMNTYLYRQGAGVCRLCERHQYRWGVRYLCGGKIGSMTQWASMHLQKRALQRIDAWLSTCQDFDQALVAFGVPAHRIMRTYHPFDWDRVAGLRAENGNSFVFNAQGRVEKGIHLFPEIMTRVHGCDFALYPASVQWPHLNALQSGHNRVTVRTDLRWETGVGTALARSRAAVLPTVNPSFGELAVYEAMAVGKPVIAFKVGANPLLVRHQTDGLLSEPGDLAGLAESITCLQDHPDLAVQMGISAKERAAALFSREAVWKIYQQAYSKAMNVA